jgi:hypothetical protein
VGPFRKFKVTSVGMATIVWGIDGKGS